MHKTVSGLLFAFGLFSISNVGADTLKLKQANCGPDLKNAVTGNALVAPRALVRDLANNNDLDFSLNVDKVQNRFYRRSNVTAHVVANSTSKASVVVGFADAGNSGASVWFKQDANMDLKIRDVSLAREARGLHGVSTEIDAFGVDQLVIDSTMIGNIRYIRDWEDSRLRHPEYQEEIEFDRARNQLRIVRRLSPEHHYEMILKAEAGSEFKKVDGQYTLVRTASNRSNPIQFRVIARSSEKLLNGLSGLDLIKPEYLHMFDQQTINMLSFIAYKEKWLAGSWRYLTYFGRDSMMSAKLMMQFLKPEAVAGALSGVLDRVSHRGWVSHEETLADYALKESKGKSFEAIQNKEMVDSNYMAAVMATDYLSMVSVQEGNAFLARLAPDGRSYREVLRSNFVFALTTARRFYRNPIYKNLISLLDGRHTGQWRDSETGLGYADLPYDVNAVLVPAALESIQKLLSDNRYGMQDNANAERAAAFYSVWSTKAAPIFKRTVSKAEALRMGGEFMRHLQLRMPSTTLEGNLTFYSIGLMKDGTHVPVMHSDFGMAMMYGRPTNEELEVFADLINRDFPWGLKSSIGLLIANPAFASAKVQALFTADHYHGTLAWGREHAIMLNGLLNQWPRTDILPHVRQKLFQALDTMWNLMELTEPYQTAELWTWEPDEHGNMRYLVYGSKPSHHTSANPIQAWSLAVALERAALRKQVEQILGTTRVHTATAVGQ